MRNRQDSAEDARDRAPRGVLFLCVANSARSQMAEALARLRAPGREFFSAGSAPGVLNPHAVVAVAELGADLSSGLAKGLDAIPLERVGTVVTLCEEELCPLFSGQVERLHWPLPDPAAASGAAEDVLAAFRRVRDEIDHRLETLLAS